MHNKIKKRKLGRTASHKKALLKNLANQLFEHKEIRTTTAKAKEVRPYVERLITYAKKGDLHHRRLAFAFLRNKQTINILFDEIAPVYENRQGGYTRVVKLGNRSGDAAPISLLQLVDFEKLGDKSKKKTESTKKKTKATKTEKEIVEKEKTKEVDVVEDLKKEEITQKQETTLKEDNTEKTEQEKSKAEEEQVIEAEQSKEKPVEGLEEQKEEDIDKKE